MYRQGLSGPRGRREDTDGFDEWGRPGPRPGGFGGRGDRHHMGGRGRGYGGRPGGGRRGRRGDVRAAVLALLAERPMHGYEMLEELAQRTQDLWRPSPGSLYPAMQLLEDQGLVRSVNEEGRRRFELTEAGRAELAARGSAPAPWETVVSTADRSAVSLYTALDQVRVAVDQVAQVGNARQKTGAERLLSELRRQVYLLLAEPPEEEDV